MAKKHRKRKLLKINPKHVPIDVVKQMLTLVTNALALVSALAWNGFITEVINSYIKKYLPIGSGAISLFIYAITVTMIAVVVTVNFSHMVERLEALKS